MATKKDFYDVLDVERGADDAVIKKAFRKLALKYHPDRNPGDAAAEARFREISEAYQVLSDVEQRARYDQFGHAAFDQQGAGGFGQAGFEEFFGAVEASEGFDPNGVELWDLSAVTVDLTTPQVKQLAARARRKSNRPKKVALLVSSDLSFGMLRMYAAFRDEGQVELNVFRDVDVATQWLSVR